MTQRRETGLNWGLLVAIILLGWGLALARLGERSLWADEGSSAYRAEQTHSLTAALELHKEYHFLHLVTLMGVVRLSRSEFALRFPSAMAAVLTLPVLYALGRRLLGKATGLVAALLLSISPFVLAYAQEARSYAMLEFFACLSLLLLVLALARKRWYWWAAYVLSASLLLYTHFFAWFAMGAQVLFALAFLLGQSVRQRRADARWPALAASLLAVGLLYLPLAGPLRDFLRQYGPGATLPQEAGLQAFHLTPQFLRTLAAVYGPWTFGWQEYLFLASFALGVVGMVLRKKGHALLLVAFWFGVPLAILAVASSQHFFDYRYLIFFVPIFLLVGAEGVAGTVFWGAKLGGRSRASTLHVVGAVGLSALLFVPANLPAVQAHYRSEKENWRNIGLFVRANFAPDEVIYVSPPLWANPLRFYQPSLDPYIIGGSATDLEQLQQAAQDHAGLWYLRFSGPLGDPTGQLTAWVSAEHFELLIDGGACGWGIHVYYRRFDEQPADRQAELWAKAAEFCPSDPRFQGP